jgi:hypothetical protein
MSRGRNSVRQIRVMMWKHRLQKMRTRGKYFEILLPFIYGYVLLTTNTAFQCNPDTDPNCTPETIENLKRIASFLNPLLLCLYIPNLTAFAARFIIQSMVEDKANKMRESLRLMSLSKLSYAMSFVLF